MKLLIISNMSHYLKDGKVVGWGPTVEEINHLAKLFDSVRHLGCLHATDAPESALPYLTENISLVPLPPAGGNTLKEKLGIVKLIPLYLKHIITELKHCDAVHVRCPANIPLLALVVLAFTRKPVIRWVKYAGNWGARKESPFFYRLQRWLLITGVCRCEVTVNGTWPNQGLHIHSFHNPCLTDKEVKQAATATEGKQFTPPYRLVFVGALNEKKGIIRLIEIAARLRQEKVPFMLEILGDGAERQKYEKLCRENGLEENVTFHGWLPKSQLSVFYEKAHINFLPSESEGWPKVLSEGMAYGVVPVTGAVASIPQILADTQAGIAIFPYDDTNGYVGPLLNWMTRNDLWKVYSINSQKAAGLFTYEEYLQAVKKFFSNCWNVRFT